MSLYPNSGNLTSSPDRPSVWFSFVADGYITCNFFNRDGRITGYRAVHIQSGTSRRNPWAWWWITPAAAFKI